MYTVTVKWDYIIYTMNAESSGVVHVWMLTHNGNISLYYIL